MKISEILIQTWKTVIAESTSNEGYYHRRLPLQAAWPAHAGIHRPTNAIILALETTKSGVRGLRLKDQTKGYRIDVSSENGGSGERTMIRIHETSQTYREIFTIFCADILEHWIPHAGVAESLGSLDRRLAYWKKFFQRGSVLGMSREDYIGLYGELSFIEEVFKKGATSLPIINSWQGPFGTNQDFLFGPLAVEIKTITGNEIDKVRITNARQLDSTGLETLLLRRFAFDFRQGTGRTLPQLIADLKSVLLTKTPDSLSVFNDKLLEAGFVEDIPNEFDSWGFTPRHLDAYNVSEGFPRLLESTLPHGVSEVSYILNLSSAANFIISEPIFWSKILFSNE